jgi:hypothetical protein
VFSVWVFRFRKLFILARQLNVSQAPTAPGRRTLVATIKTMTTNNLIDKVPITTIVVSYFFICGGLYLIGFWTVFKIDISAFISITDIPKSFVIPFIFTNGTYLGQIILNSLLTKFYKDNNGDFSHSSTLNKSLIIDIIATLIIVVILFFSKNYTDDPYFWTISCTLVGLYLLFKFCVSSFIKSVVPYFTLRLYFGYILILTPIFSFATGKYVALNIYNNYNNTDLAKKYIIKNKFISDNTSIDTSFNNLKLIGFIGDKTIASTEDNKNFIIINNDNNEHIIFIKK